MTGMYVHDVGKYGEDWYTGNLVTTYPLLYPKAAAAIFPFLPIFFCMGN